MGRCQTSMRTPHHQQRLRRVNIPILKTLEAEHLRSRRTNHDDEIDKSPITGKASIAWKPLQSLLFRGSARQGTFGRRHGELYIPRTVGTSEQFIDQSRRWQRPANSNIGGNPDLKPEKSKRVSFGAAFSPTRSISTHVATGRSRSTTTSLPHPRWRRSPRLLPRADSWWRRVKSRARPTARSIRSRGSSSNAASANCARPSDFGAHWADGFSVRPIGRVDYNGTYYTKADLTWPNWHR